MQLYTKPVYCAQRKTENDSFPLLLSQCSDRAGGGQLSAWPSARRQGPEAQLVLFTSKELSWVVTRRRGTPARFWSFLLARQVEED